MGREEQPPGLECKEQPLDWNVRSNPLDASEDSQGADLVRPGTAMRQKVQQVYIKLSNKVRSNKVFTIT